MVEALKSYSLEAFVNSTSAFLGVSFPAQPFMLLTEIGLKDLGDK